MAKGQLALFEAPKMSKSTTTTSQLTVNDLSKDQRVVYDAVQSWLDRRDPPILTIGGLAGSGKTTLTALIAKSIQGSVAFCAYTGKASSVLKRKLRAAGSLHSDDYVGTIHGLIYIPVEDSGGRVVGWELRESLDYDLVVIDEASMVDDDMLIDLRRFDVPILAVGDHGQLPPVRGKGSLMAAPQLKLEKIHRQAAGNPIIKLAHAVRMTGEMPRKFGDGEHVIFGNKDHVEKILETRYEDESRLFDIATICYMNATRVRLNAIAREIRGYELGPSEGEQVICLKNIRSKHDRQPPVFNGMRGLIEVEPEPIKFRAHLAKTRVNFPEENVVADLAVCLPQFERSRTFSEFDELAEVGVKINSWGEAGHLFDFGYTITGHKGQGSQWDDVLLWYERPGRVGKEEWSRWLYTCCSRSSRKLTVLT